MLAGDRNDSRLAYGMPGDVRDGGSRVVPHSGYAGPNIVDDNSFLGHEVGPWKASESSWRGDDVNRTLPPQAVDSGQGLVQDVPQGSFTMGGSDAGDRNWKAPVHDESFHSGRVPVDYDSGQQRSFADTRPSDGRDQSPAPGRLLNGAHSRYPEMQDSRALDTAAGLGLRISKPFFVAEWFKFRMCDDVILHIILEHILYVSK